MFLLGEGLSRVKSFVSTTFSAGAIGWSITHGACLFPMLNSMMSHWYIEVSCGESISTMEISKHYKSECFPPPRKKKKKQTVVKHLPAHRNFILFKKNRLKWLLFPSNGDEQTEAQRQ